MGREKLDPPATDRTTIVASKVLLDRVSTRSRSNGETNTSFIIKALINQLEKEGDLTIRQEVDEIGY